MTPLESETAKRVCQNLTCTNTFSPRGNAKKYCSPKCRQYGNRAKQNSLHSPTKARTNYELFETARRMADTLYGLPPFERLGYMKDLIDEARAGNTQLRELLTNYYLRNPPPECDYLYGQGKYFNYTIAQAANAYCWHFWGTHVNNVVRNKCDDPETGEVP